jgi:signal transduction histidine kinase
MAASSRSKTLLPLLGLAIPKCLGYLHGREVKNSSKIGQGTTVTITLPIADWPELEKN